MVSRALSLATVTLLIGCFPAKPAQAQNLEAGKSPSQIFAGTCTACHKGPRGLLRTVSPGSLPSFLRQHYTTSGEMASLLSGFLVSNGATDTRLAQPKPGKDGRSEPRPAGLPDQLDRFGRRLRPPAPVQEAVRPDAEPREVAKPDADGIAPQVRKRLARPGELPPADGAASDRGPDGRRLSAKHRPSKRGRPGGEEPAKADAAKTEAAKTDATKEEPAKGEVAKDELPKGEVAKDEMPKGEPARDEASKPEGEPAKDEASKPEGAKPPGEGGSESAGIESSKGTGGGETAVLRADPVPPVTPAPPASPAVSAAASGGASEPPVTPPAPPPEPPAMTASVPPPPPIAPAGPPAPPISQ
jgi:hypothetical protein